MNIAIFGAGCFWCVEAIFLQVNGVTEVISGYTGGRIHNPTYEQICSGNTGHAEVCKITYDSTVVNYEFLLKVLFETHDPTTLNKQGLDQGTQYRSSIFYVNDIQKQTSINFIKKLEKNKVFNGKITTEVTKLDTFFKAEDYHQNYYNLNSNTAYCKFTIKPKLDKFLEND